MQTSLIRLLSLTPCLGQILWTTALPAADLVHAKDGSGVYGYKDTPKLPWCQWLVHDPDRPNPRQVAPSKPGSPVPAPADAVVLFDGHDLSQWQAPGDWKVADEFLIAGNGEFATKANFGD